MREECGGGGGVVDDARALLPPGWKDILMTCAEPKIIRGICGLVALRPQPYLA